MLPKMLPEPEKDREAVRDISPPHHLSPSLHSCQGFPLLVPLRKQIAGAGLPVGRRAEQGGGANFKGARAQERRTENLEELQTVHRHTPSPR